MYCKIICLDLTTAVYNFKKSSISYLVQKLFVIMFSLQQKKKIVHAKIRIFCLKDIFRTSYKTNMCYFHNGLPITVSSLSVT